MKRVLFLLFVAACACASIYAREDVGAIVEKANRVAYYEGDDGRSLVTMTIVDSQNRKRKRVFTILRMDIKDGGEQKYYVFFREPSDVEDMVYMVWKHLGKDDDRWMYLPALDLVRRIAASDKRSSFVGANFLYEDISGRALTEDTHELVSSGKDMFVIKNTPKDPSAVEFSYYNVYIRKDNYMPVKAEYFNKQGKLSRVIEALEQKEIDGHPTVTKSKASDLEAGSYTVIEFSDVQYDIGLEDKIFTERYLRRPPRKWLQ